MKPNELIEQAQAKLGGISRYKLHKLTGISEGALSAYVTGKRWPDNTQIKLLADVAGLDWAEVMAGLEMEKAQDELTRTMWGKALAALRNERGFVSVRLLAVIAGFGWGGVLLGALWGKFGHVAVQQIGLIFDSVGLSGSIAIMFIM